MLGIRVFVALIQKVDLHFCANNGTMFQNYKSSS